MSRRAHMKETVNMTERNRDSACRWEESEFDRWLKGREKKCQ